MKQEREKKREREDSEIWNVSELPVMWEREGRWRILISYADVHKYTNPQTHTRIKPTNQYSPLCLSSLIISMISSNNYTLLFLIYFIYFFPSCYYFLFLENTDRKKTQTSWSKRRNETEGYILCILCSNL